MASHATATVEKTDRIDTHVHIFAKNAPLAADHRYAPDYDALPAHLVATMREAGLSRALLVQPSFLGTDNSFLLEAIAADPTRFAGIAVVDPTISLAGLDALRRGGIVGVRLNCIGKAAPDFSGTHRALTEHLAALGMVLQIQAEGAQWLGMEAFLSAPPICVVIDHFGRTAPDDPSGGFASLLRAAARSDRMWFKFSAPYRLAPGAAASCACAILKTVGGERIVWGSDWPHTQFEGRHTYREALDWLASWVPDASGRANILSRNPAKLFGLSRAAGPCGQPTDAIPAVDEGA